jgi:hypothetical protein
LGKVLEHQLGPGHAVENLGRGAGFDLVFELGVRESPLVVVVVPDQLRHVARERVGGDLPLGGAQPAELPGDRDVLVDQQRLRLPARAQVGVHRGRQVVQGRAVFPGQ